MLFLAVFCGFLAENFREHRVENHREKQFIQSFIRDVEMDTARLQAIIINRNERMVNLDSLIILINLPDASAYSRYIYHHSSYATRMTFRFYSNDGTMQQLKNAGNLRLIGQSSTGRQCGNHCLRYARAKGGAADQYRGELLRWVTQ